MEMFLAGVAAVIAIGWVTRKLWSQCRASVPVPVSVSVPVKCPRVYALCPTCEGNQARKIRQLASFKPVRRRAFNSEVDAYQLDLERVYKLCRRCERTVEKRLRQVQEFVQRAQPTTPRRTDQKKTRSTAISPILVVALVSVLTIALFCEYLRTESAHKAQYLARIRNYRLEVATVTDLLVDMHVSLQEALEEAQRKALRTELEEEEEPPCAAIKFPWD